MVLTVVFKPSTWAPGLKLSTFKAADPTSSGKGWANTCRSLGISHKSVTPVTTSSLYFTEHVFYCQPGVCTRGLTRHSAPLFLIFYNLTYFPAEAKSTGLLGSVNVAFPEYSRSAPWVWSSINSWWVASVGPLHPRALQSRRADIVMQMDSVWLGHACWKAVIQSQTSTGIMSCNYIFLLLRRTWACGVFGRNIIIFWACSLKQHLCAGSHHLVRRVGVGGGGVAPPSCGIQLSKCQRGGRACVSGCCRLFEPRHGNIFRRFVTGQRCRTWGQRSAWGCLCFTWRKFTCEL